jgi:hypothetical protein
MTKDRHTSRAARAFNLITAVVFILITVTIGYKSL